MRSRLAHGLTEAHEVGRALLDLRRQIPHRVRPGRQLRRRHQRRASVVQAVRVQRFPGVPHLRVGFGRVDRAPGAVQQLPRRRVARLERQRLFGVPHGRLELAAGDRRFAGRHRRGQRPACVRANGPDLGLGRGRRARHDRRLVVVEQTDRVGQFAVVVFERLPQPGQIALEQIEVVIAIVRALGEAAIDHDLEPGVEPRAAHGQRLGLPVHDVEHRRGEVALERLVVGEHFVQHQAHGEDVAAVVDRLAGDLLGRHVVHRADQHARLRAVGAAQLGDAEVEHLEHPRGRHHQVGRLHVPMHQVRLVGVVEPRAQFLDEPHAPRERQRHLAADEVGQRVAGHVLHGDVRASVVRAVLVDRDDVGMRELGDVARFFFEAPAQFFVVEPVTQQLDGDQPVKPVVAGEEHLAHAAGRNGLDHRVAGDVCGCRAHRPRLVGGWLGPILA